MSTYPPHSGGDGMTSHDEKVKRLLDGEIDEEEIASDPVLASLAERIFGLNIEPIAPSKPSTSTGLPAVEIITAVTSNDSMVEVIPGNLPMPAPLPDLAPIPTSARSSGKKGSVLKILSLAPFAVAVANIFGAFGFLNSMCSDKCGDEFTRINWAGIMDLSNELGWSEPFPVMGIPDYVAVGASILLIILAFRRK